MRTIRELHFEKGSDVPNSRLPVLLYRSVLPLHSADKANTFREHFKNAGWTGIPGDLRIPLFGLQINDGYVGPFSGE